MPTYVGASDFFRVQALGFQGSSIRTTWFILRIDKWDLVSGNTHEICMKLLIRLDPHKIKIQLIGPLLSADNAS